MEVTVRNVDRLQHVAVSRLTLFVAGEIHALIEPFQRWLADQVRQAATDDGLADTAKLAGLMLVVEPRWAEVMRQYASLLRAARVQAADVGFTSLRVKNNARFDEWVVRGEEEGGQRLMVNGQRSMVNGPGGRPGGAVLFEETFRPDSTDWMRLARMWIQRRNAALATAQQRVWGDGLTLSTRIWRLEAGGLQAIRQTLATGMAERTSAWELAQRLEGQLGANADFPRWTRQRLHALTPRERAQDLSGLLRAGDTLQPWQSRGVSYNALRLARTEIQYANHAVTSEIARNFPGIVGRKSRLSPEHPVTDICDEYAAGGPYGPDADFLPLHPQCVTPGQMVETERGAVRIEDVRVGDLVLTHQGRMRPVAAVWEQHHSGPVYEICTDGGRFEVTGNHPVLLSRGWVNAESVQPGDQVVYAGGSVCANVGGRVAEDVPAVRAQPGVAAPVIVGVALVPAGAVAFDGDLAVDDGEVYEVAANLVLALEDDAGGAQGIQHGLLGNGRIVETNLSSGQQHGHEAGIVGLLGKRDFAAHVRSLGDVGTAFVQLAAGDAHAGGGRLGAGAVVLDPLVLDGLAAAAQRNAVGRQHVTKDAIGDAVLAEDFGGGKPLFDVDGAQEVGDGDAILGFDAQCVEFGAGDVVGGQVGACHTLHLQAANGASNGHDNLLSLSPGVVWGAGPGCPVVRGVASPSQALTNYATVRLIRHRDYDGLVHNLTVADDHSYVVNGHAVHNCLCYWEEVLMPKAEFAAQVRGWAAGENDFLDGYSAWLDQRAMGPWVAAAALDAFWTVMDLWMSGEVDAMALVLKA